MDPHEQVKNGNVLKFIKDYWFIIAFIVSAAFAWSELRSQVHAGEIINEQQQQELKNIENSLEVLDKRYIEDITFIKTTLNQLLRQ